jgi:hypothetical protein
VQENEAVRLHGEIVKGSARAEVCADHQKRENKRIVFSHINGR